MSLLRLEKASRIYKMGEIDVPALQDADLSVEEGEFLVVVGPSGSGKSTLLNIVGGMDRPTAGKLLFGEEDLTAATDRRLTVYRRRQIGFVFQFYNLIPTLTALENVQVATEVADDPMEAYEALELVDLADRAGHFPSQLSGGQQQRVAIARAVASNPRMLLCDEPTGALDQETGRQVLGLLQRLNRDLNKTVILITHNQAISQMAKRVASMRDGRIVSIETNAEPATVETVEW